MSPTSLVWAIVATLAATICALVLSGRDPPIAGADRFVSLDGLRGYLALFVFLHHSSVWYSYVRTGQWGLPPSRFYVHLGQSSVALFFMITGFLFYSKLINARDRPFDWEQLYLARVLRLTPLYLFAISLLLLIVLFMSHGVLRTSPAKAALDVLRWIAFTIFGHPDLNRLGIADAAMAQVTWTLPYEWFFYLALPLFALSVGIRPSGRYLLLGLLAAAGAFISLSPHIMLMFAGGIIAAVLVGYRGFRRFAGSGIATLLASASIGTVFVLFPTAFAFAPLVLLSVFFCIVAGGNDLLGLLSRPAARTLGEMSYSLYLLHGLLLYTVFDLIVGMSRSAALSALEHWMIVIAVIPALLLICRTTFRFIEYPAMQARLRIRHS